MPKKKTDDSTYIRSVPLNLKYINQSKKELIRFAMQEYRNAMINAIDYFWEKHNLDGNYTISDLQTGKYYPYDKETSLDSPLTRRMVKCAHNQAMGMIKSAITPQLERMLKHKFLQEQDKLGNSKQIGHIQRKIHKTQLVKPKVPKSVNMTLDSNNCTIYDYTDTSFNMCIELSSLFLHDYKHLTFNNDNKLPLLVKTHRRYYHWLNKPNTRRTNSVLINDKYAYIRFKTEKKVKEKGIRIAIDQGIKNCISSVDDNGEYYASGSNNHGYDLDQICKLMTTKTKGTKSYKKITEHRRNYVNWCINQLNLDPYNELILEEIKNIGFKQVSTEYLKKFPTKLIRDKLQSTCEEKDVLFSLQSSPYRSQRCSDCGYVHSRNRKGKSFICRNCGFIEDSDINAARNHLAFLPEVHRWLIKGINRTTGFYWNPGFDGVYTPIS